MKKIIAILAALACLAAGQAWSGDIPAYKKANAAADGRAIADKVDQVNRPKQDLLVYAVMVLKSGDSVSPTPEGDSLKPRPTAIFNAACSGSWIRSSGGTHLPDHRAQGRGQREQYLYLPSMGRPRQVAASEPAERLRGHRPNQRGVGRPQGGRLHLPTPQARQAARPGGLRRRGPVQGCQRPLSPLPGLDRSGNVHPPAGQGLQQGQQAPEGAGRRQDQAGRFDSSALQLRGQGLCPQPRHQSCPSRKPRPTPA